MKNYKDYKAREQTNSWLASQGLGRGFGNIETLLLKAQMRAHRSVGEQRNLLTEAQIQMAEYYLEQMKSPRQRAFISEKQCYAVMNLSKKINRRNFKAAVESRRLAKAAKQSKAN